MGYLAVTILVYAAAFAAGGAALDALGLKRRGRGERLVFGSAMGIGALALIVMLMGVPGWYYRPFIIGLLALPVLIFPKRFIEFFRILVSLPGLLAAENNTLLRKIFVLFAILVLVFCAFICFTPPITQDVLRYHLMVPRQYILNHGMVIIPSSTESNFFLNPAMIYLVGLMLRDTVQCAFLHWGATVLAAGAMYLFYRRHGGPGAAAAALLLAVTQPMFPWTGGIAGDTFFHILFMLTGFHLFLDGLENDDPRSVVAASVLYGFALGTKITALAMMGGMQLFLLYGILFEKKKGLAAAVKFSFALWTPALLVVLPWAVRSYVFTGNPVFPLFPNLIETRNLAPFFRDYTSYYGDNSVREFFTYLWTMTVEQGPYRAMPISPALLGFLPLPFIAGKIPARVKKLIAYSLVLYAIHWGLKIRVDRYIIIVVFVYAGAAGWGAHRILSAGGFRKWVVLGFMLLLMAYSMGILFTGRDIAVTGIRCALNPSLSGQIQSERLDKLDLVIKGNESVKLEPGEKFVFGQLITPHAFFLDGPFILASNNYQGVIDYRTLGSARAIRDNLVSRGGAYFFDCVERNPEKACPGKSADDLICPWTRFVTEYVDVMIAEDGCYFGRIVKE